VAEGTSRPREGQSAPGGGRLPARHRRGHRHRHPRLRTVGDDALKKLQNAVGNPGAHAHPTERRRDSTRIGGEEARGSSVAVGNSGKAASSIGIVRLLEGRAAYGGYRISKKDLPQQVASGTPARREALPTGNVSSRPRGGGNG